jgi:sterol desaturase/sphingolipid hydroxylase (fatty acid hydroxylase superfamily)
MEVNYIALSIPVFFILIGIELIYGIYKKQRLYRFSDAITNISCGVGQQLTGILLKAGTFALYFLLYEHARLFTIGNEWYWWVVLFLGVDFCYYWFHRTSHEVNAIWATHIVHHQSEDYNLSVALRQSWFQGLFSALFYLPLAFLGFNPMMTLTVVAFNTLYQFWIHTRAIGKLGWLEYIFNTPSHHRVHHGSNPKYLDKNHAGTLIIWDRLFGTFQEEEEEPVYGITKPLKSWNPAWANLHYWKELTAISAKAQSLKDKILVFIKPPGWRPAYLGGFEAPQEPDLKTYQKYDVPLSKSLAIYIAVQFALQVGWATLLLFSAPKLDFKNLSIGVIYVIFSITALGAMLEQRSWAFRSEWLRLVFGFIWLLVLSDMSWIPLFSIILTFFCLAHWIWVRLNASI